MTTTDGDGRYEFMQLPAGRYMVSVVKSGYVSLQYGQRRPSETVPPLSVSDGDRLDRVDFSLPRGAVIAIRVTDDFGDPLAGAQVQVQRYQYGPDGQRRLTGAATGALGPMSTDDRGEFRAYGLTPGEYVVSASSRNNTFGPFGSNASDTSEGFAPTFYPGTVSPAEAQTVSVGVGDEASVQFSLVAARLSRVSGSVMNSEGRPVGGAMVQVITSQAGGWSSSGTGTTMADGTFAIGGVAPGEHSIEVRSQTRPGDTRGGEFGSAPIVVSGADITGVRIVTGNGARISGRVVFEGRSPRTNTNMITRVTTSQVDPSRPAMMMPFNDPVANGTVDSNGNFQIAGLTGRVFFNLNAPPPWLLKSITVDGEDITDTPLDLTNRPSVTGVVIRMTDNPTQIAGQVSDARGQIVKDYVVVVLPADVKEPIVTSRLMRTLRPDSNGRFQARGMRLGRYVATAIETIEQGHQFAPEFQEQLRRGAREFSIREGESVTLDLKLTPGL